MDDDDDDDIKMIDGGNLDDDDDDTALDKKFVADLIEKAWKIVDDIVFANDYVVPCFPISYKLTKLIPLRFHANLTELMECVAENATSLSNAEIIILLEWGETYTMNVSSLFEGAEALLHPPVSETLRPLITAYCDRSRDLMAQWSNNILKRENETAPQQIGKKWYSPGGVDLFAIVGSQISAVLRNEDIIGTIKASLLGPLIAETGGVLKTFAEKQREYAMNLSVERGPMCLEKLVACANNQLRSYKENVELAEQAAELMFTYLDLDESANAFLETGTAAVSGIVDVMFVDIDSELNRLFGQCTSEEECKEVCGTIVATFEDYYGDLKSWLEKSMWKQLIMIAFEKFVIQFVAIFLCSKLSIEAVQLFEVINEIVDDITMALSVPDVDQGKIAESVKPLNSFLLVATAPAEYISIEFEKLLHQEGPIELKIIESLCDGPRRQDMEPAQSQEIVSECKEIYSSYVDKMRDQNLETEFAEDTIWGRIHSSIQRKGGWGKLRRRKTTLVKNTNQK